MSFEIDTDSETASQLQNIAQSKLLELGWTDHDDSGLAEYIKLLVTSGRSQDEISTELKADFIHNAELPAVQSFVQWLFQQALILSGQAPAASGSTDQEASARQNESAVASDVNATSTADDANMSDVAASTEDPIPTEPKSMRNTPHRGRDKRILGQVNRALERNSDGSLHKIKGTAGTGRINSHASRGSVPRGPRGGMQRNSVNPMLNMNTPMAPNAPLGTMSPQQQMQLFAMMEEQARMFSQFLTPQQQQQMFPAQATAFPSNIQHPNAPGRSLFDRVENKSAFRGNRNADNRTTDTEMGDAPSRDTDSRSMLDIESSSSYQGKHDPNGTMCKFNLTCTKPDCPFVHQSPAAPPGTSVDMTDTCSYGAACTNRKCTGKHPSPSQGASKPAQYTIDQDCRYYPNCSNPVCPFRHPTMPPCRNGADCSVPNCKFFHNPTPCKYNPCLNPACPFKHEEGQKRGKFEDKVWINTEEGSGEDSKQHVSERKFVEDEHAEEDLVVPAKTLNPEAQVAEQVVT